MGCVVAYDTIPSDPRLKDGSIPLHTAIGIGAPKDYERKAQTSETLIKVAMIRLMLRRLVRAA
jgi:hypothetical protein